MAANTIPQEAISLHNEMVLEISKILSPLIADEWAKFLFLFNKDPLTLVEIHTIKSIQELFNVLMRETSISYGSYKFFIDKVRLVNKTVVETVEIFTTKIRALMGTAGGDDEIPGSAQVSTINPGQTSDSERQDIQRSGQLAISNTGLMPGAGKPRPHVDQSDTEIDLPRYKMDAKPRGLCIIINNEKFSKIPNDDTSRKLENRLGTNHDAEKLKSQFGKLEFIVEDYKDQSDVDMVQLLSGVSSRDHNQFDCLVCCILTHGIRAHVFGSNGKAVEISELTSFFRAQKCPSLVGKPKLFFIQACQGGNKQGGLDIETDTETGREIIPDEADFILGYATVPGYVSYRSPSEGSLYINKLVDMLDKYADSCDLMSILVKVNEEVGRAIANVEGGHYKQIPAPQVTLRKKLFFK